jgi:hypothetical protein
MNNLALRHTSGVLDSIFDAALSPQGKAGQDMFQQQAQ